jgi:hypothetical protein
MNPNLPTKAGKYLCKDAQNNLLYLIIGGEQPYLYVEDCIAFNAEGSFTRVNSSSMTKVIYEINGTELAPVQ